MTFLFVLDDVYDVIESAMRALSYFLCKFIYELIVSMYNIFDRLCNSRILDSSVLQTISERVGILLGIIMLFMVAFSVIQMILDPDKLSDKEKGIGNILKKIILVIVMLGVSSFAFSLMYGIQKKVIDSNIIQRFLLPYEIKEKDNFGGILSYNLFNSFFYIDTDILSGLNLKDDVDSNVTQCYTDMYNLEVQLKSGVKDPFQVIDGCVNKAPDGKYIISFNWILAPLVGAGVLYFIFNYCISVGIRTIQLAFLEIMAPMAIISYLSPKKDNMFQKWIKLYFSTYLDVFLRIMIINLIVFLIMTIFENSNEWIFWNSVGGKSGTFADIAIQILMIFALLTFAKKAPDLIKDLFPAGASKLGFGVSTPKQLFSNMLGGNYVENGLKRGYGMAAVGFGAWQRNTRKAIGNAINAKPKDRGKMWGRVAGSMIFGGLGGMRRGLMTTNAAGRKQAIDNAVAARQSKYKMHDLGYGLGKQISDAGRNFLMQDQYIDDLATMKDVDIENRRQALIQYRQKYQNDIVALAASKSHKDKYIYQDATDGPVLIDDTGWGTDKNGNRKLYLSGNKLTRSIHVADEEQEIGKATSDSKKLHQKAEEQKQKNK